MSSASTSMGDERLPRVEPTPEPSRTVWSRSVAPLVAGVIVIASVALALVAQHVTENQERTLLTERAGELAALLSVSTSETRSVLLVAGTSTTIEGATALFDTVSERTVASGRNTLVVARQRGSSLIVVAQAGEGAPATGTTLSSGVAEVLRRAQGEKDLVSGVVTVDGQPHLILALAVAADTTRVAYLDSPLTPATPAPTDPNSPYRELNVAVYSGESAEPGQLILLSGDDPGTGSDVVRNPFPVGAESWLLVIAARTPLVGSLASAFPWLLVGSGAATAVFLALLIEILVRRRSYALRLVEERTRSLRAAQLAAERANNAKSEFLSRMSHELRTPLNAVLGFAQLLELGGLDEDQAENVGQITKGGRHLLDLINEVLDISQIETGHMSMSPEPVLATEVINAAAGLVRSIADDSSIHLIVETEREPDRYIFADRQRLKQILLNLLSNGIKYNRRGGSVSISCFESSRGTLRIQVTDTGPGIAAEKMPLLFTPFERLGAERTTVEGTGVGLALARGLAEAMGGRLDVESTPGRGSTFWVEFPIVESPLEAYGRDGIVGGQAASDPDRALVLHIEDNPANLALVERVLAERPEIGVISSMQGRMGLELARRHRPALILLDLNLADLPGEDVLRALRSDPVTAGIPVVVVSADAMPRQIQRLMSSGAVAYLTKPIDIQQLLAVIDETLGGSELATSGSRTPTGPERGA